jgi:hypothetical protein
VINITLNNTAPTAECKTDLSNMKTDGGRGDGTQGIAVYFMFISMCSVVTFSHISSDFSLESPQLTSRLYLSKTLIKDPETKQFI